MLALFLLTGLACSIALVLFAGLLCFALTLARTVWMVAACVRESRQGRADAVRAVARNRWQSALRGRW